MSQQTLFTQLQAQINLRIIGQEKLLKRLLIALLADGHLLVEGAPGLAKTTAIKTLAQFLEGDFHRIQFTPDLLPADVTGTEIYRPQDGSFVFQQGPLFHNLLLADEINRAPAKVQSALLEAMAERQVTVGRVTYPLPELFLVMATQNPIEQEGTYPLPEAQLDRFLLFVRIDYPDLTAEKQILDLARREAQRNTQHSIDLSKNQFFLQLTHCFYDEKNYSRTSLMANKAQFKLSQADLFAAREEVLSLYLSEPVEEYLIQLVGATRQPQPYGEDLARWIQYGASPRATIALDRCARAHAWLEGRDYVSPEDVQAMAHDILRHRVLLSYEAEADGLDCDQVIDALLARVAVS